MKLQEKIIYSFSVLGLTALVFLAGCKPQKPNTGILTFDQIKYKLPKYDSLEYFNISPDGSKFMALYKIKGQWFAQVNKSVTKNFQGTLIDSFCNKPKYCFSPEGSKVGLVYKKERAYILRAAYETNNQKIPDSDTMPQWFVQINQNIYGGFDGDHMPEVKFSSDGSVFGFVYKNRGAYYIRLNDEVLGPYQKADMTFTIEGHIALATVENGFAYLNEMEAIPLNK